MRDAQSDSIGKNSRTSGITGALFLAIYDENGVLLGARARLGAANNYAWSRSPADQFRQELKACAGKYA